MDSLDTRMRAAFARVDRSEQFARSPSLRRVLRYLVDAELRGEGGRLTPYRVAVEAFGRPADFNPAQSASVRVEMNRLRRLLMADRKHNETLDSLAIAPNSYRPVLVARESRSTSLDVPTGPAIAVFPRLVGAPDVPEHITVGLAQLLIEALSRSRELYVVQPFDVMANDPDVLRACTDRYGCAYAVRGDVIGYSNGAETVDIRIALFDALTSRELWSRRFTSSSERLFEEMDAIAAATASQIGDPAGVLTFHAATNLGRMARSDRLASAELLLRFHLYRVFQRDPDTHEQLRACTNTLTAEHPWFALGWMMQGALLLDEHANRFNPTGTPQDILTRARVCLEQAIALDGDLARAVFALGQTFYFKGDFGRARELLLRATDMNPNDADIAHMSAMLLCLGGAIDEGMALLQRSCLADPAAITYRLNAAMCFFAAGELADAQALIDRITTVVPRYLPHLVTAIVCAASGQTQRAAQELEQAYRLQRDLSSDIDAELRKWVLDPVLADRTLALVRSLGVR